MVRSLAVITWKKPRAEKIEHAGLIRTLYSPFDPIDYHKLILPFGRHRGDVVLEWIKMLSDSAIQTWAVAIKSAQDSLVSFPTVSQLQALEASSPFIYQYFVDAG